MSDVWDAVPPVPKRKPGDKPAPKPPLAKPSAPKPQQTITKEKPQQALLDAVTKQIEARVGTNPKGVEWEVIVKVLAKQYNEEQVNSAIDWLNDENIIYEPVLGRLLPTNKGAKTTASKPLDPPTPVQAPTHVPKATEAASKSEKTQLSDSDEVHAKFGGTPKKEGYTGKIRSALITVLHGNPYVSYAGLLDAAHDEGLARITTTLVQIPSKDNGDTAIVSAAVVMRGKDGAERTFTGIGDANKGNVKPMMAMHIIRLAETRAKARALRDAINIGVAAIEELAEEEKTA